jgi:hypothetical protein
VNFSDHWTSHAIRRELPDVRVGSLMSDPAPGVPLRSLIPFVRGHLPVPRALIAWADLVVLLGRLLVFVVAAVRGLGTRVRVVLLTLDRALDALLLLSFHMAQLPGGYCAAT